MKTAFLDHYDSVASGKDTFERFAELLKNGKSIIDAWFEAVSEKQRKVVWGVVIWQGKASAIYSIVEVIDYIEWSTYTVDYSNEGFAPYSTRVYPSPHDYEVCPVTDVYSIAFVYATQS